MNIPILPDKSYKFLIYVGLGLVIYFWLLHFSKSEEYEKKRIEFNVSVMKINDEIKYLDEELKDIAERVDIISQRNSLQNPLQIKDSTLTFQRIILGKNKDLKVNDSLSLILESYLKKNLEVSKKKDLLEIKEYELNSNLEAFKEIYELIKIYFGLGALLFFIGLITWERTENYEEKILKRQNIDKPTFSEHCQSCAKNFNSMIKYGSEENGTKNYHFCQDCYKNGEFVNSELSQVEMKQNIENEMIEKGKTRKQIKKYLRRIDYCERWK